jgi:hypothetical protein
VARKVPANPASDFKTVRRSMGGMADGFVNP